MLKGSMTRNEVIEEVGEQALNAVEAESCDFTNRVMGDHEDAIEFAASVRTENKDGEEVTLVAYYYPTTAEIESAGEDLSNVNWVIYGYEIYR